MIRNCAFRLLLKAQLASLKPAAELNLDDAIEPQTVLHRQLFAAFAEDAVRETQIIDVSGCG